MRVYSRAAVATLNRKERIMIAIKKLLVPTDFSEYSRFALKYAVALAENFQAKVYVIHVHEPYPHGAVLEGIYYDPAIMEEDALDAIVKELRVQKIDAEAVFVKGRPFMEIIRQAEQLEADLIVIATHGRKGVSHFVFGSTAEKVVRMAPCPVLTVKHPEHEFVG
jgi:nucleotide-binding universal stress UspA family protein